MSQGGMGGGIADPSTAVASGALLGTSVVTLPATGGYALLHMINIAAIVALSAVLALFVTAQVIKRINK